MFDSQTEHLMNGNQADQELFGSQYDLDLIFRNMINAFIVWESVFDGEGRYVSFRFGYFNEAYARISGLELAEVKGKDVMEVWPHTEPGWVKTYGEVAVTGVTKTFDMYHEPTRGWYHCNAFRPAPSNTEVCCIFEDITERLRAETEREKLRVQLMQSQKMESIGRLAGGIAHDFNNMLSVILVNAEFVAETIGKNHPVSDSIRDIIDAARHSSDLTRPLLTFARKQQINPYVIDLNDVVGDMMKMLERLIGENITLVWKPYGSPCMVKMDPTQIDQILANLVINSRDAIREGGRIEIETDIIVPDNDWRAAHPESASSRYASITVRDNGHGIDENTRGKLFEPFFTTKPEGKGSGLGLATVYGIVKQNKGFIDVESEPGKGSTFAACFECHDESADNTKPSAENRDRLTGSETILLVEDEPSLLKITGTMLRKLGYTVLATSSPGEAIHISETHPGEIHLILTDIVMPGMSGKELAERLCSSFPSMKALFMSGYALNMTHARDDAETRPDFIQKPFTTDNLAAKIREILGGK